MADPNAFDGACRDLVELVTEYLEGTLPPDVARRVADHLDECPDCVEFVEQFRATIAVTGSLPRHTLPPATQARLVEAFGALLRST